MKTLNLPAIRILRLAWSKSRVADRQRSQKPKRVRANEQVHGHSDVKRWEAELRSSASYRLLEMPGGVARKTPASDHTLGVRLRDGGRFTCNLRLVASA